MAMSAVPGKQNFSGRLKSPDICTTLKIEVDFTMPNVRINLIMPTAWVYGAEIARGVLDFATHRQRWDIHLLRDRLIERRDLKRWLIKNPADAAIVLPRFNGCSQFIATSIKLIVTVCDDDPHPLMRVGIDDVAVGETAGRHLRERGLKQFAFVQNSEGWSQAREHGFRKGCMAEVMILDASANATKRDRWLRNLPKPIGLFAGNDLTAATIMDACVRLHIVVPHDLALLGADDDQLLCLSTRPALSSVRVPWREVGRTAARTLAQLLTGKHRAPVRVPPLGVTVRPSTDTLSVNDRLTVRAIEWIHSHAANGINVEDVVRGISSSRSQLERHLHAALGHGPLFEIRRARVERATRLLQMHGQMIGTVAKQAGFPSTAAMQAAFQQFLGLSPQQYQRMIHDVS